MCARALLPVHTHVPRSFLFAGARSLGGKLLGIYLRLAAGASGLTLRTRCGLRSSLWRRLHPRRPPGHARHAKVDREPRTLARAGRRRGAPRNHPCAICRERYDCSLLAACVALRFRYEDGTLREVNGKLLVRLLDVCVSTAARELGHARQDHVLLPLHVGLEVWGLLTAIS